MKNLKTILKKGLSITALLLFFTSAFAKYTEVMDPDGLRKNMRNDYGLVDDNAENNQSAKLQKAIDEVTAQGGGIIEIPKGTYRFSVINMKSNVHILIDAGTVIMPTVEDKLVFLFGSEKADNRIGKYIENVSIRGVGGPFIIDFHFKKAGDKQRAINVTMIKNFLISNMDVKDNYTTYCGISMSPTGNSEKVSELGWEISRPTDGTIQNIRHFRGSPAYGQLQIHGAQSCHFENLYSLGGYAFRLESGADNINVGLYDLTAKNITCENGKGAMIMGPHSAKNGKVTVDGVTAISCFKAVSTGDGHVKENAPDQTPGYFSSESSVKNIHAIFGTKAQFKHSSFMRMPNTDYYDSIQIWSDNKHYSGPSVTAVTHNAKTYDVTFENVTMEGFPYNNDKPILLDGEGFREGAWGAEVTSWKASHTDSKYFSDQGVVNDDYTIPSIATAINDVKANGQFKVFPNPAKRNIFIKSEGLENASVELRFSDMTGKTVISDVQYITNSNPVCLNIEGLESGFYLLGIRDKNTQQLLSSSKVLVNQ